MTTYLLPYTAGTVTTNGTTTVTGALTAWLANVKPGDRFRIGTSSSIVASVESNTSMTLESAWSGSASGQSYAVDRWSRGWFSGGDLALALALYNTNRPTFIPTTGQPSDAVGSDGNVAFDASANTFYKKDAGAWDSGTSIVGLPGEITRSGAQTGGLAKFVSDTEIGQATANDAADLIGSPRNQMFNLFEDGGRFGGTPEVQSISLSSYVAPNYITAYNGSTLVAGNKFVHNNTTFGGSAGALAPEVQSLIEKIKSSAGSNTYRRYGPEFYLMKITAGSGTAGPITVGATTYYLCLLQSSYPSWPRSTFFYNVYVESGAAAISNTDANYEMFSDGVLQSGNFALPTASWRQIARRGIAEPNATLGYDNNMTRLYATAGSVIHIALPTIMPFNAQVSATPIGVIPSLRVWR